MKWYSGPIAEAVAEAKRNNKLLLVYCEGTDDLSKAMTGTYDDVAITQKLSKENIIALKLAANSVPFKQFSAFYPVVIIPSSFFISGNGSPIEIITGSLTPSALEAKINNIIEMHETSNATKASTSALASTSKDSEPSVILKEECPDPSQPSTSQSHQDEEDKAPLEERLERAKVLLDAKKQIQDNEEKEKEKREEIERRFVGRALQKAQQEKRDNELREWANNRAQEKEEERIAREKVRALIQQDRVERAARYQRIKDAEQVEKERLAKVREEQDRAARSAAVNSNEARLQFRLPDGSYNNHVFPADSSLDDVRNFVRNEIRPPFSNFTLCMTFPRRHFTQSNYSESLRDLQLAPSAVLLILPDHSITHAGSGGGFWSMMFWTLLAPFVYSWRTITSFFSGTSQSRDRPSQANAEPPKSQNEQRSSQPAGGSARQRNQGFVRQDGNIYRMNNQSDDGENNTWNGNSTQQM